MTERARTELRKKQERDTSRKEERNHHTQAHCGIHHEGRADEITDGDGVEGCLARPSKNGACAVHAVYIVFCLNKRH